MAVNNLMLEAARNRLQYWQDELKAAQAAGNVDRIHYCTRFIREYGVLLEQMADALKDQRHEPQSDNEPRGPVIR